MKDTSLNLSSEKQIMTLKQSNITDFALATGHKDVNFNNNSGNITFKISFPNIKNNTNFFNEFFSGPQYAPNKDVQEKLLNLYYLNNLEMIEGNRFPVYEKRIYDNHFRVVWLDKYKFEGKEYVLYNDIKPFHGKCVLSNGSEYKKGDEVFFECMQYNTIRLNQKHLVFKDIIFGEIQLNDLDEYLRNYFLPYIIKNIDYKNKDNLEEIKKQINIFTSSSLNYKTNYSASKKVLKLDN